MDTRDSSAVSILILSDKETTSTPKMSPSDKNGRHASDGESAKIFFSFFRFFFKQQ